MRDFSRSPDSRYPDQRNDGNCNSREEAVAEIRARLNKVTLPNGERVTALGVNRESKEGPPGPKQDSRDCQATETDKSARWVGICPRLRKSPTTIRTRLATVRPSEICATNTDNLAWARRSPLSIISDTGKSQYAKTSSKARLANTKR